MSIRLHFIALVGCTLTLPVAAHPTGYPTLDRVLYVQECVRSHAGPPFEMASKCACAIDKIAEQVRHPDYVNMTTVVNAVTIGGERGGELRDNETIKPQIARWRELQAKVQKACFLGGPK